MTATFMPLGVVSTTNRVEGNESDIERAPLVPFDAIDFYFEEITRRTTSEWALCKQPGQGIQRDCMGSSHNSTETKTNA